MMRLFVTGASGFVGRHVESAAAAGAFGGCEWLPAAATLDIRDPRATVAAIAQAQPDVVIHLAALSFIPESFADPRATFEVNLLGTLNLLQALRVTHFQGRMIYVSSGDVYGRVPESELPVDERRIPEPRSPYAVSKVAAEHLCLQWNRSEGLDVIIARPFNHIGPGQDARFVLPSLARQIIAISSGVSPPIIEVGDIDTTRDFTDVRDVASAYAAIVRSGRSGSIYVIGSGKEHRIRDLLLRMCQLAGIEPDIRVDPARMRAAEQRRMAANASLLTADTGWAPRISMETTLTDIIEAARSYHP